METIRRVKRAALKGVKKEQRFATSGKGAEGEIERDNRQISLHYHLGRKRDPQERT